MLHTLLNAAECRPWWRALLSALLLLVCWLAFTPNPASLKMVNADKLLHTLAFACLAGCAALSMAAGRGQTVTAATAMFCFGMFVEAVQTTLPGRSGEWQDLVADAAGIAAGLGLIGVARRWRAVEPG
ncbi:MAG: VanZ family protein [Chitinophagaceae bacterium]|nr:VanZ family protein [Rubrivivax sp.]